MELKPRKMFSKQLNHYIDESGNAQEGTNYREIALLEHILYLDAKLTTIDLIVHDEVDLVIN